MIGARGSRKAVLEYLKTHPATGLSSAEAFELFGVTRLAAIIYELRKDHHIDTVMLDGSNRFGEHSTYAKYHYRGENYANNTSISN